MSAERTLKYIFEIGQNVIKNTNDTTTSSSSTILQLYSSPNGGGDAETLRYIRDYIKRYLVKLPEESDDESTNFNFTEKSSLW